MQNQIAKPLNSHSGLASDFKNSVANVEGQLKQMSHDVGEKMGDLASSVSHTASTYAKEGREYVRDNPGKGLMMAAATGAAVGSLLTLALLRKP